MPESASAKRSTTYKNPRHFTHDAVQRGLVFAGMDNRKQSSVSLLHVKAGVTLCAEHRNLLSCRTSEQRLAILWSRDFLARAFCRIAKIGPLASVTACCAPDLPAFSARTAFHVIHLDECLAAVP